MLIFKFVNEFPSVKVSIDKMSRVVVHTLSLSTAARWRQFLLFSFFNSSSVSLFLIRNRVCVSARKWNKLVESGKCEDGKHNYPNARNLDKIMCGPPVFAYTLRIRIPKMPRQHQRSVVVWKLYVSVKFDISKTRTKCNREDIISDCYRLNCSQRNLHFADRLSAFKVDRNLFTL